MRTVDSLSSRKSSPPVRRDGWTAERQLAFLHALARTRSVVRAAAAAGMSRESAYRLRTRPAGALFAAAWDRTLAQRSQMARTRASQRRPLRPENGPNAPRTKLTVGVTTRRSRGSPARVT